MSISIIVQSYNFAPFLGEAIRWVLALRDPFPDEIVIIDDASRDGSAAIAQSFDDPRLRVIVNEHILRAAENFNRAFEATCGDFVARLDGDDRHRPDFLTHAMGAFAPHPEAVAAHGRIEMIAPTGRVTSTERHGALLAGQNKHDATWRRRPSANPALSALSRLSVAMMCCKPHDNPKLRMTANFVG